MPPWSRVMSRLGALALDIAAPRACAACDADLACPADFCEHCSAELPNPPIPRLSSLHCGPIVASAGAYTGPLARAIRRLKYDNRPDLAEPLARLAAPALEALVSAGGLPPGGRLIPVPLHQQRLAARGFNQAALIAGHLARLSGRSALPLALRRRHDTRRQASLGRADRLENLRGAFHSRASSTPAPVILVDDVVTTGATLSACVEALEEAGNMVVGIVTIARTLC